MNFDRHTAILKALGKIAECKNDLQQLSAELGHAPLWLPGRSLEKQCHQATGMIDGIAERFERKLVLTLVGPSGSGKSTLLNALAGVDNLSPTGHQRPTTGHVIVFSSDDQDDLSFATFPARRVTLDRYTLLNARVRVPLPKIFFFNLLLPGMLKGEDEFVVIGGVYEVEITSL